MFGERFCLVWVSFDVMCCTSSILNLCAISLDRYIHIKNPLRYESCVTPNKLFWSLLAIWVLSVLISFVPIQLGWHQMGMDDLTTTTIPQNLINNTPSNIWMNSANTQLPPDYQHPIRFQDQSVEPTDEVLPELCTMSLSPQYAVLSSIISFFLPCLVMILIYYQMYRYARHHAQNIQRTMKPCLNHSPNSQGGKSNSVSDHKAAITLGVIMGTFLFCWTPFFVINIIGSCCSTCIPPIVFSSVTWLGYFNSTLNPIIYSIFNKEFREAFKRVLRKADPRMIYLSNCVQSVKNSTGNNRRRKTGYNSVSSNIVATEAKRCTNDIITTV